MNDQEITLAPSRLPISPAIAKEYDITPPIWRVLVEQTYPSAKTVEAIMMALAYCKARKLDILKRPVHIVPMWNARKREMVETVWPGISEIRTTATRTGQYAGIDAVEYGPTIERKFMGEKTYFDRQKKAEVTERVEKTVRFPEWASVVVYRILGGAPRAYHAKVFWEETYAAVGKTDVPNEMWSKRPFGQIDKCVEAAALRKAFPEEIGNDYAAEEMEGRVIEGSIVHVPIPAAPQPPKPPAPPSLSQPIAASEPKGVITVAATDQYTGSGRLFEPIEVYDSATGEVTDAVQEVPAQPSGEDFLTRLRDAIAECKDADEVSDVWEEMEVGAWCKSEGDFKENFAACTRIRKEKLAEFAESRGR